MAVALQRREKRPARRGVAFWNRTSGTLLFETGHRAEIRQLSTLLEILAATPETRVVYLLAGRHTEGSPRHDWYKAPAHDGWTVTYRAEVPPRRVAVYRRNGVRIDLRHTSAWFDDANNLDQIARAYAALETQLRRLFGPSAQLWGSPAQTGLDLLDRAIPWRQEYPILSDEYRHLIHNTAPQPRREQWIRESEMPAFYYLDARFAYAGCLRNVPVWLSDDREWAGASAADAFIPFRPARYLVTARVPETWAHIGLLPEKADDIDDGWKWPNQPGQWLHTWADGQQVQLALDHGWKLKFHRRLLFADTHIAGADPLYTWQKKLVQLWTDAATWGDLSALCRAALRNIVLYSVGSFHRQDVKETMILPFGTPLPDGVDISTPMRMVADGYEIERSLPLSKDQMRYSHPEWSAAIWARAQTRLTRAMLKLPPQTLVGCNTDQFYSTLDPLWPDDGRIGTFRIKGQILTPRPWPRSRKELEDLKDRSVRLWEARHA